MLFRYRQSPVITCLPTPVIGSLQTERPSKRVAGARGPFWRIQPLHARALGPLTRACAARRRRTAYTSDATARRWMAAAAPRPTYCKRSSFSLAFSRRAVNPHLRLRSHARVPMALPGSSHRIPRQCRTDPHCAMAESSLVVAGDASPHAPNTTPRTGSKVRSFASTGPTVPCIVPQYLWSADLAFAAYSAGRAFARLATAWHLASPPGYVLLP